MLWRYVLDSPTLRQDATLVVPDLPGVGGSDSFAHYGPTEVLEAVTEFVVAMREQYLDTSDADIEGECQANKVFIVGHDWGCVLSYRLAAEAPCLADRFILTNGPHACIMDPESRSRLIGRTGPLGDGQQRPHSHLQQEDADDFFSGSND